jgi:hypothetical protein
MGKRNELSTYPVTKEPVGVGPEAEIKYSIPYKWGALHVTDSAHESYGFKPLTAEKVSGDEVGITESKLPLGDVDIYLMGPDEFRNRLPVENDIQTALLAADLEDGADFGLSSLAALHRNGVEVYLGFSATTEDAKAVELQGLEKATPAQGVSLDDITTEQGIPFTEAVDQQFSQGLIHVLSEVAGDTTSKAYREFLEIKSGKLILKTIRETAIFGAAGLVGVGMADLNNQAVEVGANLVVAGSFLAVTWEGLQSYFKDANKRSKSFNDHASLFGRAVRKNIHDSYCAHYFNKQTQALFDQS